MLPTIRRKLEQLAERHEELEHLLASPEVLADSKRLREVSREHAQLSPLAVALRAWEDNGRSHEAALAMQKDPELRELALEEAATLEDERERLERELNLLLVPKDQAQAASAEKLQGARPLAARVPADVEDVVLLSEEAGISPRSFAMLLEHVFPGIADAGRRLLSRIDINWKSPL